MFTQGLIFGFMGDDSNYFTPPLVLNQVHSHYSQLAFKLLFFFLDGCIRNAKSLLDTVGLGILQPPVI